MHFTSSLIALLAARASSLALPQVDVVEVHDPVDELIAAYQEAVSVPVAKEDIVIPSVADAVAGNVDSAEAIAAAVADAVSGGLEKRIAVNAMDVEGFEGPFSYGDKSIRAPTGDTTYMGVQTFPRDTSYNPNVCAEACKAKSAYNIRHAEEGREPRICRFFNSYTVYANGDKPVFTCTYYTQPWTSDFATNAGSTRSNVKYTNRESNGYSLIPEPKTCVNSVSEGGPYKRNGVSFRVFEVKPDAGEGYSAYSPASLRGNRANHVGLVQNLIWANKNWPNNGANGVLAIGDLETFNSQYRTVLAQGFFEAPESGTYTFQLNDGTTDDNARFWIGDKAYSDWNDDNADVKANFQCGNCNIPRSSAPIPLTKGQIYPFTYLWYNHFGQGRSDIKILDASGKDWSSGRFVQPCDVDTMFPVPGNE